MMYAGVEAVAEQWRPLDARESAVAARLLDRVSALMRRYSRGLDARVAVDPDLAVVAAGIAVDAVLRVLRSNCMDAANEAAEVAIMDAWSLHLTPEEIASLMGDPDDRLSQGAFTIRPAGHAPRLGYRPRSDCPPWR